MTKTFDESAAELAQASVETQLAFTAARAAQPMLDAQLAFVKEATAGLDAEMAEIIDRAVGDLGLPPREAKMAAAQAVAARRDYDATVTRIRARRSLAELEGWVRAALYPTAEVEEW